MNDIYDCYSQVLRYELKPALGCTEPVAIAYAAATAVQILGQRPDRIVITCSGNVVKNVKGVTVPNSGGMKGVESAAILGAIGGNADLKLEVLSTITAEDRAIAMDLVEKEYAKLILAENIPGLYVKIEVFAGSESAEATLANCHDQITRKRKNGKDITDCTTLSLNGSEELLGELKKKLSVSGIIDYANNVEIGTISDVLERQIELNSAISEEGLNNNYGSAIGKTLMKLYDSNDVRIRARAKAAAGSDARMGGCALPVVINSGSGNQGLTVSMPVVEFAHSLNVSHEKLLRALALSNLMAIHQKQYIGPLSAYCGAVSAAAGASAAISYLLGGGEKEISESIANTLAMVGGIVCDGAKASCAAKIASALDAAILSSEMAIEEGKSFACGDGLVKDSVEQTIKAFGKVGKDGMQQTDIEILHLMIDN